MNYRPELTDNNIVLSRVRLARNIKGRPFYVSDKKTAAQIVKDVTKAAARAEKFSLYYLSMRNAADRRLLKKNIS